MGSKSGYLYPAPESWRRFNGAGRPRTGASSVPVWRRSLTGPVTVVLVGDGSTEDLADLITNHQLSYHLYADDTQLLGSTSTSNIRSTVDRLQSCVAAIHQWCDSRRLQLNPTKTELIWFGSRVNLQKIATADQSLRIDRDIIHSVASVRDLG